VNLSGLAGKRPVRELRRRLFSRFLIDANGDSSRAVLVAGSGRTGTTWLAEALNYHNDFRLLFEPFHRRVVKEHGWDGEFGYIAPDAGAKRESAFAEEVFSGHLRNPWVDAQNRRLRTDRRLIKDISSNLMLKWLCRQFPDLPIILLIRHPFASASSRRKMGWPAEPAAFLDQPALVETHLSPFRGLLSDTHEEFARHVLMWCVEYYVPLLDLAEREAHVVFYEDLVESPVETLTPLLHMLEIPVRKALRRSVTRPSTTSRKQSAVMTGDAPLKAWLRDVTEDEVKLGLEMLAAFGLDEIYSEGHLPKCSAGSVLSRMGAVAP
jgi:hypothetical protein